MTFLFIGIAFNMTEILGLILIFFINLSCIDPNRRVSLMAFLILATFVFILFKCLTKEVLVSTSTWDRVLARLDFFQVSVLKKIVFLRELIAFEASGINFSHSQGRLEACFCFSINNFFYNFFSEI